MIITCDDCVYCSKYEYNLRERAIERYCDCDASKFNDGDELDMLSCGKCNFFKHKDIIKDDFANMYSIEIGTSMKNKCKNTIFCKCADFNALNNFFIGNATSFYTMLEMKKENNDIKCKLKELYGFVDFVKQEIPDVYNALKKEYGRRKK